MAIARCARMRQNPAWPPGRQGGWAGLVTLLLALVILGLVVRTIVRQMGLADPGDPARIVQPRPAATAGTGEKAQPAGPAMQQVRDVEAELQRHAKEAQQRLDAVDR